MAGDWIKIRHDLRDDPACLTLSDKLSDTRQTIVGLLVDFWTWADRHTPDGSLPNVTESAIDCIVNRQGFAAAMVLVGWLEKTKTGFEIPNFERHHGNSAKARALESEAKRIRRSAPKNMSDTCRTKKAKNVRPEKRRGEKNKKKGDKSRVPRKPRKSSKFDPSKVEIPSALQTERFKKSWSDWIQHRIEIKKALTKTSVERQLNQFEEWGCERSCDAIEHTIRKGWTGIREDESSKANPAESSRYKNLDNPAAGAIA